MPAGKFVRDSVGFTTSQYTTRVLQAARGVLAAGLLGPAHYGAWNAISLLMEYGAFATLGTQQGLDQAVPGRIVDQRTDRLERLKRAGLFNILVLTGLFTACVILYFVQSSGTIRGAWGMVGILAALFVTLATNVSYYHMTLFRSHGNIAAVSLWFLIQSGIGVPVGLALIPALGMWGLLWGWVLSTGLALAFLRWRGRAIVPMTPRPSHDSIELVRVGLPMYLYVATSFVMRTLDRVIILRFLGNEALGLYGLAVMASSFLLHLPDSVTFVLYPHLLRRFREGGDRAEAVGELAVRVLRAMALLMPALCGLLYVVADDAVAWLFPRFVEGLGALRILCFGTASLALANLASIILMTLGRRVPLVATAFLVVAMAGVLDWTAVHRGYGIVGVASATFAAYTVNGLVLLLLVHRGLGHTWRTVPPFLARMYLPLVIAMPLAFATERLLPWAGLSGPLQAGRLALAAMAFLGAYVLLVAPMARGLGLTQLARRIASMRGGRNGGWGEVR